MKKEKPCAAITAAIPWPVPEECPKCHSRRIKFFGTGTQKAEAQIAALPEVKVLRMDQDSTLRKFAHEEILNAFSKLAGIMC